MLDSLVKPFLDPILEKTAAPLARTGLKPILVTVFAFVLGLCGFFTVAMGAYMLGLTLILIARFIDGVAARAATISDDFSDYLRISLEWILYAAFVFFFALTEKEPYMASAFLLFSYVTLSISALAYKVIVAKYARTDDETALPIFHPARYVERSEILIFMVLACLAPAFFSALAVLFGMLVLLTAGGWILKARQTL
jgi:hypothetical protein